MIISKPPARALLCGLDPDLAHQLHSALKAVDSELLTEVRQTPGETGLHGADMVFCSFTTELAALIQATSAPVVVVSRHPEVNQWLDALEAGAADYCSTPFEASQIRWILQSNLSLSAVA